MKAKIDQEAFSTIDKTLSIIERSRALSESLDKMNDSDNKRSVTQHVKSVALKKNESDATAKRDIKNYLVIVADASKLTAYEKRLYLKRAYNSKEDLNECDRALKTFYRDAQNNLFEYNRESSYKLVKEYIKTVFKKNATKDYFTTSEVELHYKVFGPSISDNTLASCRKLQLEKAVKLEAVYCSDVSKRVKYYKIHVVKQ